MNGSTSTAIRFTTAAFFQPVSYGKSNRILYRYIHATNRLRAFLRRRIKRRAETKMATTTTTMMTVPAAIKTALLIVPSLSFDVGRGELPLSRLLHVSVVNNLFNTGHCDSLRYKPITFT